MREHLTSIVRLLRENGEPARAVMLEDAIEGTDEQLGAFLTSNELWGGSGSVADCALVGRDRSEARRAVERVLIRLGNEQLRAGTVNPRIAMWVEAFTKWKDMGL